MMMGKENTTPSENMDESRLHRPRSSLMERKATATMEIDLDNDDDADDFPPSDSILQKSRPPTRPPSSLLPVPQSTMTRIPIPSGLPRKTSRPASQASMREMQTTPLPSMISDVTDDVAFVAPPQALNIPPGESKAELSARGYVSTSSATKNGLSSKLSTPSTGTMKVSSTPFSSESSFKEQSNMALISDQKRLQERVDSLTAELETISAERDNLQIKHDALVLTHSEQLASIKSAFAKDVAELEEQMTSLEGAMKQQYEAEQRKATQELSDKLVQLQSQNQLLADRVASADAMETEFKFQLAEMKDMASKLESHSSTFLQMLATKGLKVPATSLDQVELDPAEIDVTHFSPGSNDSHFSSSAKYILILEKMLLSLADSLPHDDMIVDTEKEHELQKEKESRYQEQIGVLQAQLDTLSKEKDVAFVELDSFRKEFELQENVTQELKSQLSGITDNYEQLKRSEEQTRLEAVEYKTEKDRLCDTISRLESQLSDLKTQCEVREREEKSRFEQLSTECALLEAQLQASEQQRRQDNESFTQFQAQIEALATQKDFLEQEVQISSAARMELASTITDLQGRLDLEKMEAETLVEHNFNLREQIEKSEQMVQALEQTVSTLEASLQTARASAEDSRRRMADLENLMPTCEKDCIDAAIQTDSVALSTVDVAVETDFDQNSQSPREADFEAAFSVLETQLTALKEELVQSSQVITSQGEQITTLEHALGQSQLEFNKMRESHETLQAELSVSVEDVAFLSARLDEKETCLAESMESLAQLPQLEKNCRDLIAEKATLVDRLAQTEQALNDCQARLSILEPNANVIASNLERVNIELAQKEEQLAQAKASLQSSQDENRMYAQQTNSLKLELSDVHALLLQEKESRELISERLHEKETLLAESMESLGRLPELEMKCRDLAAEKTALLDQLGLMERALKECQESLGVLESIVSSSKERIEETESRLAEKEEQLSHINASLQSAQEENESCIQKVQAMELELNDTHVLLTQEREMHVGAMEALKAETEQVKLSWTDERAQYAEESSKLKTTVDQLSSDLEQAKSVCDDLERRLKESECTLTDTQERMKLAMTEAQSQIVNLNDQLEAIEQTTNEARISETKYQEEIQRLEMTLERSLSESDATKSLLLSQVSDRDAQLVQLKSYFEENIMILEKRNESLNSATREAQNRESSLTLERNSLVLALAELQVALNALQSTRASQIQTSSLRTQQAIHVIGSGLRDLRWDTGGIHSLVQNLVKEYAKLQSYCVNMATDYQKILSEKEEETKATITRLQMDIDECCTRDTEKNAMIESLQIQEKETRAALDVASSSLDELQTHFNLNEAELKKLTDDIAAKSAIQEEESRMRALLEEKLSTTEFLQTDLDHKLSIMTKERDNLAKDLEETRCIITRLADQKLDLESRLSDVSDQLIKATAAQSSWVSLVSEVEIIWSQLQTPVKDCLNGIMDLKNQFPGLVDPEDSAEVSTFETVLMQWSHSLDDEFNLQHIMNCIGKTLAMLLPVVERQKDAIIQTRNEIGAINDSKIRMREELDTNMAKIKLLELDLESAQARLEEAEVNRTDSSNDLIVMSELVQSLRAECDKLKIHSQEADARAKEHHIAVEGSQNRISELQRQIDQYEIKNAQFETQITEKQTQLSALTSSSKMIRKLLVDAACQFVDSSAQLDDVADVELLQLVVRFMESLAQSLNAKMEEIKQFESALQLAQSLLLTKEDELEKEKSSYLKRTNELKEKVTGLSDELEGKTSKVDSLTQQYTSLQKEYDDLLERLDQADASHRGQLAEAEQLKLDLETKHASELIELKQTLAGLQNKSETQTHRVVEQNTVHIQTDSDFIHVLETRNSLLETASIELEKKIADLTQALQEKTDSVIMYQADISKLKSEVSEKSSRVQCVSKELESVNEQLDQKKNELVEKNEEIDTIKRALDLLRQKENDYEVSQKTAAQSLCVKESMIKELKDQVQSINAELNDCSKESESLKEQMLKLKEEKLSLENKQKVVEQEVETLRDSHQALVRELEVCHEQKSNVDVMYDKLNSEYLRVAKEKRVIEQQVKLLLRSQSNSQRHEGQTSAPSLVAPASSVMQIQSSTEVPSRPLLRAKTTIQSSFDKDRGAVSEHQKDMNGTSLLARKVKMPTLPVLGSDYSDTHEITKKENVAPDLVSLNKLSQASPESLVSLKRSASSDNGGAFDGPDRKKHHQNSIDGSRESMPQSSNPTKSAKPVDSPQCPQQ